MGPLFDKLKKQFMPDTPGVADLIKRQIISQSGLAERPIRSRNWEDEMEVDLGHFENALESAADTLMHDQFNMNLGQELRQKVPSDSPLPGKMDDLDFMDDQAKKRPVDSIGEIATIKAAKALSGAGSLKGLKGVEDE